MGEGRDGGLHDELDHGLDGLDDGVRWDDEVTGDVERLPGVGGWHVVRLPPDRTGRWRHATRRGFVPVTARIGGTTWDSSLMPMGDGTLFAAVPAHVRRAEDVEDGDLVRLRYRLRVPVQAARPRAVPARRDGAEAPGGLPSAGRRQVW